MRRESQEYLENNPIDQKVAESFNRTDQQRAKELEAIKASISQANLPKAPVGELQKIMDRVEEELDAKPSHHKKNNVRKMVKMLAAAAVLGAMVIGGSMWVGAKRYYTYEMREEADLDNVIVFDNNEGNLIIDSRIEEKRAYKQIEEELGIEVLELSYLPEGMVFYKFTLLKRKGMMEFAAGEHKLFFYQGLNDRPSSLSYVSDMKELEKVYNEYLEQEISLYQRTLDKGEIEISVRIVNGNQYALLYGIIDEEIFKQIVCGIKLYGE
ncbi:MAG: hypothetical protein HFG76_01180 [Hungatella sp.]|nr:hypothetical protein [Hungatella sp.]